MRRLYLRIYLAVLASLLVFACVAGLFWRSFIDAGPTGQASAIAAELAQNILPAAGAARIEQQAALEKLAGQLRADVALFAPDRTLLAAVGEALPPPDENQTRSGWLGRSGGAFAWALRLRDDRWLVARLPQGAHHPGYALFAALALLALGVGVGAYPVVRRLTRRLERLQAGVESLGAGDLSARVRVVGRDEVAALAASFNRAAARIEQLVGAHKTLLANASHELRTPLTRIRMGVELMQQGVERERRAELERDIAELDQLIDEILLASRLDAVAQIDAREPVDLLALAAEECARYEACTLEGETISVSGDPRLLRRMIRNLLENAARHGAPPIEVRLARVGDKAEFRVRDHGQGIPESERERVFEPFYRFAGSSQASGAGLGLALVRSIARRHGGEAECVAPDGNGSCLRVVIAA